MPQVVKYLIENTQDNDLDYSREIADACVEAGDRKNDHHTIKVTRISKRFVVAIACHPATLIKQEVIEANTWQEAVLKHSKYPYRGRDESEQDTVADLSKQYPDLEEDEAFKQACFDCDTLIDWIEV